MPEILEKNNNIQVSNIVLRMMKKNVDIVFLKVKQAYVKKLSNSLYFKTFVYILTISCTINKKKLIENKQAYISSLKETEGLQEVHGINAILVQQRGNLKLS